jgi:7-cyano-7-deazaguanine synthase
MERAVVLLSGGLDSTTCLAIASQEHEIHALTFDYGSKHSREINAAKLIADSFEVKKHTIVNVGLDAIGSSSLTDENIPVDKSGKMADGIPASYVPARNVIFLSIGVALAESIGASKVYIGANSIDSSGYPDCRPEFIEAFQNVIEKGTKMGVEGHPVKVVAPLLRKSKTEIVQLGTQLGVPFELTWTCYAGCERACGRCEACLLRLKGFEEAGLNDPVEYEN